MWLEFRDRRGSLPVLHKDLPRTGICMIPAGRFQPQQRHREKPIPRVVELDETFQICISPDGYVVICIYVIYLVASCANMTKLTWKFNALTCSISSAWHGIRNHSSSPHIINVLSSIMFTSMDFPCLTQTLEIEKIQNKNSIELKFEIIWKQPSSLSKLLHSFMT